MVDNLLSNAMKFTPADGDVCVTAWTDGEDVRMEVRDTGIGMADADREKVFERFFRASSAVSAPSRERGSGCTS